MEMPHEQKIRCSTKGILGGNKREERVKSINLLPKKRQHILVKNSLPIFFELCHHNFDRYYMSMSFSDSGLTRDAFIFSLSCIKILATLTWRCTLSTFKQELNIKMYVCVCVCVCYGKHLSEDHTVIEL